MKPGKICKGSCGKPLLAFQGYFLHPDIPCNGVKDSVMIEAEIKNETIQEQFEQMYGKPDKDDYERVMILEKQKAVLINEIKKRDKIILDSKNRFNLPFEYLISKLFKRK